MENILSRIEKGEVIVADGAMGTLLMNMAKNLPQGSCTEVINLDQPELLENVSSLYFQAGSEIIQTNTFSASPLKLAGFNMEEKTEEVNKNAVRAVRKVVKDKAYVSASCGPSGKLIAPLGNIEESVMYDNYYRQLKAIIEEEPDIICIETMSDINEIKLAISASKNISSKIPVMATMTFEGTSKGFFTMMGVTIETAAKELKNAGADIIGSNCGNGSDNMILIAEEFRKYSTLPLLIQSNAGLPELRGEETFYPESPEYMASKAEELIKTGVSIIGGCCGSTPDHIKAIRNMVDNLSKKE